ncbi:hypothetical protein CEW88_10570 [Alloyangia pacifica]|uniref:EF-hand domain-containing protein n=1 Tax=Alloyangia pacifica TaxID=311180 RepID=A0A2U8HE80_9RHOB|nr:MULTISPECIES: hypothetical protein [Roseobacteraceae]AWI84083.1 hypothetical protein CEW88_10570 [Alloyangia pacifica]NDV48277.1 hypothetical protein [Salipiger sp. PrR003]NDW35505.1 hypothetical protein [Salipiger sp. PrR007]
MNAITPIAAAVLSLSLAAPALAGDFTVYEGVPADRSKDAGRYFSQLDLDRNGVLTWSELVAAYGDSAFDAIMAFDGNADRMVTRNEMRAYDDLGTGGPAGLLHERVRG